MAGNEVDYVKMGARIKAVRVGKRLQQAELAYLAGLTTSHMSHIETGQTKPSLPTVVRIANVLGVSVDELLSDSLEQAGHVHDKRFASELADCDSAELQALLEIVRASKIAMRKVRRTPGGL